MGNLATPLGKQYAALDCAALADAPADAAALQQACNVTTIGGLFGTRDGPSHHRVGVTYPDDGVALSTDRPGRFMQQSIGEEQDDGEHTGQR
ncbi:MAG: hypothetical protein H0T54_06135 [Geodermatophilaceae bacterium]|nr:hypothetical protein [Geodermatophilaceae bacterium]